MAQARVFNNTTQTDSQVAALKLPPHSIEAEQSLLGGLLLDNSAWDRIADQVSEADFYRDDHRRIFRHIARLIEAGRPADVVTVYESLEKSAEVEQAGGMAYLGEIANNTPSAANIKRYAEIVRERAILRKLVTVGDEIAASALNPAGREAKRCSTRPSRRSSRSSRRRGAHHGGLHRHPAPAGPGGGPHPGALRPRASLGHHRHPDRFPRPRHEDLRACSRATWSSSPAGPRWARPPSPSTSPNTSPSRRSCRWRSSRWKCRAPSWPCASSHRSAASTSTRVRTGGSTTTSGSA
jgi:hypothetical protein